MSDVHIVPIKILNDNYVWLIIKNNQAIAIDVGDEKPVLNYLQKHQLELSAIFITHHHHDHIGGVANLKSHYPNAKIYAHQNHLDDINVVSSVNCDEGDLFELLGIDFKVWRTAGHTDTHLSYLCDIDGRTHVFCGDTLFSGGCGRVFTGTIEQLFNSMERFNALPENTLFYPTHEYTLNNLKFGLSLCADKYQPIISDYKNQIENQLKNDTPSLPTDLKTERLINVFLQTDDTEMINNIQKIYPLTSEDKLAVFGALRELKNRGL